MKNDDDRKEWHQCRFEEDESLEDFVSDGVIVAGIIAGCATLGVLLILLVAGVWME